MDTTLSQALREAYASAPKDIIYHTIELRHSAFSTPIRVVRDNTLLNARLESTAPANPSTYVDFIAFAFDLTKPEISTTTVPQISLELDNVDRAIVANIELAMVGSEPILATYREFLASDLSTPQNNPPLHMTVLTVEANVFKVTATLGFPDVMNKKFPTIEYDAEVFPSLVS
jgi:hypothetical protein